MRHLADVARQREGRGGEQAAAQRGVVADANGGDWVDGGGVCVCVCVCELDRNKQGKHCDNGVLQQARQTSSDACRFPQRERS